MGLVNKVVAADELLAFAQGQAAKLAALPAASIRATKQLMKGAQIAAVEAQMKQEMEYFGAMLKSPEAAEALTAFFEKRCPDFRKFA
jgi:enoyl-CoA hydratase/carnithine racemase